MNISAIYICIAPLHGLSSATQYLKYCTFSFLYTLTLLTRCRINPVRPILHYEKKYLFVNINICILYLYKARLKDKEEGESNLINSCNEFYGACRHVPRFHWYQCCEPSTDEGQRLGKEN